jgi:hypothetical protein
MSIAVNVENFARAESDRMFASFADEAGGVNRLSHHRAPTAVDRQPVIRMNRDTLYSAAVVDISDGAHLTIPDGGRRYVSVMVVNQDHYINRVFHDPGRYALTVGEFDTPWVAVAARVLVDPKDDDDVATVNALQDGFAAEAQYVGVEPRLPVGEYSLTVRDVPVDGFWSISVYNAAGYFEPNDRDAYSVNNLTATPNDDGSVTVHFGGDDDRPNLIPIMDGWNYTVRLYRPRPEVLKGSWTFPELESA